MLTSARNIFNQSDLYLIILNWIQKGMKCVRDLKYVPDKTAIKKGKDISILDFF